MRRMFFVVLSMFAVIFAVIFAGGCGGDSSGGTISTGTSNTTTGSSQNGDPSPTALAAKTDAENTQDMAQITSDAGLALVSDMSGLTTVRSIRAAVAVPTLPTAPPGFPSGSPTLATTTVYGTPPNHNSTNYYVYVSSTDLTTSWAEWTTAYYSNGTNEFSTYWQLAAPVSKTTSGQTRGYIGSSWVNNNALQSYTVGTGTYYSVGIVNSSGTEVLKYSNQGVPTNFAFTFDVTVQADGAASGTLVFDNGTGSFVSTAPNVSAAGTANVFYVTTGTITLTSPVAKTITFTNTYYGNGTMKVEVNSDKVTTTLTFNADDSGSGTVTGSAGKTISLTWNWQGTGTATITTTLLGTKTVPITIPPRTSASIP